MYFDICLRSRNRGEDISGCNFVQFFEFGLSDYSLVVNFYLTKTNGFRFERIPSRSQAHHPLAMCKADLEIANRFAASAKHGK